MNKEGLILVIILIIVLLLMAGSLYLSYWIWISFPPWIFWSLGALDVLLSLLVLWIFVKH